MAIYTAEAWLVWTLLTALNDGLGKLCDLRGWFK